MDRKQLMVCIPLMLIMAKQTKRRRDEEAAFRRYWKGKKLCGFTRRECDLLRRECNFTPEELQVFNLRAANAMIVATSMKTAMSERTVNRRVASIKRKIFRVMR